MAFCGASAVSCTIGVVLVLESVGTGDSCGKSRLTAALSPQHAFSIADQCSTLVAESLEHGRQRSVSMFMCTHPGKSGGSNRGASSNRINFFTAMTSQEFSFSCPVCRTA